MSVPVLKLGPDFLIFHPPSAVKTRNKLRIHGEALPEDLVRKSPLNYTEKMPKKRKFECAGEKSSEKRRELRREKGGVGMGLRMMPEEVFFGLCQGWISIEERRGPLHAHVSHPTQQTRSTPGRSVGKSEEISVKVRKILLDLPGKYLAKTAQNSLNLLNDTKQPSVPSKREGMPEKGGPRVPEPKRRKGGEGGKRGRRVSYPRLSTHALAMEKCNGNEKNAGKLRHVTFLETPNDPVKKEGATGRKAFDQWLRPLMDMGEVGSLFWGRCVVYRDLWSKGYIVTSGAKFGFHFLVYEDNPLTHHASFAVQVISAFPSLTGRSLSSLVRMTSSIKKALILAYIPPSGQKTDTSKASGSIGLLPPIPLESTTGRPRNILESSNSSHKTNVYSISS
ncbi:hypothetical protein AAMO2058_000720800 [Amorphochlora amoebiformis]